MKRASAFEVACPACGARLGIMAGAAAAPELTVRCECGRSFDLKRPSIFGWNRAKAQLRPEAPDAELEA